MDKGIINEHQLREILNHSQKTGLRFGDSAMDLGLLTQDDLLNLFGPHYSVDYFHLDIEYFPQNTREFFDTSTIIKYGALPLGTKKVTKFFKSKKILNLGLLNPALSQNIDALEALAVDQMGCDQFAGVKVYLLLADQFLDVLEKIYNVSETEIRKLGGKDVDEALQLFLQVGSESSSLPTA